MNTCCLDCLRYAHGHSCPWDEATTSCAARNGHLDCLRYAHENDCPWDLSTLTWAALQGHLDCLRFAHENGYPWDFSTLSGAAQNGHLDCLRYAYATDCPWEHTPACEKSICRIVFDKSCVAPNCHRCFERLCYHVKLHAPVTHNTPSELINLICEYV